MASGTKEVDDYISTTPKPVREKLKEIRVLVREVAPTATERIYYQMPYFDYKGQLIWYRWANGYIGLYFRPPIIAEHKKELARYVTTKSAIHLPLDEKIPAALIKKLVRARMRKNEKGD
jgi:uncharacterized protein YdhG (YjbR/CyaY superfamily)